MKALVSSDTKPSHCSLPPYCLLGEESVYGIPWQSLAERFAILSDSNVFSLYSASFAAILRKMGYVVEEISFSAGEAYKTRETKAKLEDALLEKNFGKKSCLIALGGGVTLDLVGFVAATYCRGIPFVSFPTSLLAMVDACIGGKTGVNTLCGKNLIGAFYHPSWVGIDPSFLRTLPAEEWKNGWVEMIKMAAVFSPDFFFKLEQKLLPVQDLQGMEPIIAESCSLKQAIVAEDPDDRGKRKLLNFGHTVGHALETLFAYQISHGRAVAVGMLLEGHIAWQKTCFPRSSWERLYALLLRYEVDVTLPRLPSAEELFFAMRLDKKNHHHNVPQCVHLRELGEPVHRSNDYSFPISLPEVAEALVFYRKILYREPAFGDLN